MGYKLILASLVFVMLVGIATLLPGVGSAGLATNPIADISITERGCTADRFVLTADREPHVSIVNHAAQAMVFSIPDRQLALSIAPGQVRMLDIPRSLLGTYDYFCLTEQSHGALNGAATTLVCNLEPAEMRPYALSSGLFVIAPHQRDIGARSGQVALGAAHTP